MLQETKFSQKDGFYIWFDRKYKKEYYITQVSMCKIKFLKEKDNKFNSIKLINGYSSDFTKEDNTVHYSTSNIINPFEENYGMFLINFLNADFSCFETAYFTFLCFYGMNLLEELCKDVPKITAFKSEQEFKITYENIFDKVKMKLKELQNIMRLATNYSYSLKRQNKYSNMQPVTNFVYYSISKNLFKYTENIDIYFNINYAYNTSDIISTKITPYIVRDKINDRIINPTESNIYTSRCISNLVYLTLNEIATNPKISIGICKNCGKYFISYKPKPDKYCKIAYAENDVVCKDIGIQNSYKKKQKDNPCLALYRKIYQKKLMFAKRSNDKKIKQEFDNWKILAKEKVKEFESKNISEKELILWLKDN